ncbi:STAS domain-containing protein [Leptospira sp. GIMC2001]|uniref:STAS domain-containing protein n=1 Tax=Leptospira sp. GIMC2001 TaxID=1513297 RepID=UPI00234A8F72|nr:STAS domain-containing protein [Leptospira sp. GIMC2001]WCL49301.1 STAS domain-containing protein [Leptospira sp. GIMC2001]
MEIIHRTFDSIPVLDIIGEVDLYNAREVKEAIDSIVKQQMYEIIVNLEKVPFMDSSGIGTLVTGMYKLKKYHGNLKVTGVSGSVAKVFKLTGMESHLEIHSSVEEAVKSFKQN